MIEMQTLRFTVITKWVLYLLFYFNVIVMLESIINYCLNALKYKSKLLFTYKKGTLGNVNTYVL